MSDPQDKPEDEIREETLEESTMDDDAVAIVVARRKSRARLVCTISGRERPRRDLVKLEAIRPSLLERIRRDRPDMPGEGFISRRELARYRALLVEDLLREDHGELTDIDRAVAASLADHDTLAENIEEEYEDSRTFGEIVSDKLASFGGSWSFLLSFGAFLVVWMLINLALGESRAFDSYPFILLNLVLSCLAAIQAPVIMMSQRRQEDKDRLRSLNDYKVNLKAELEIRHLHEKLDHLMSRQWQRLAEIQQLQLEIMQEKRLNRIKKASAKATRKTKALPPEPAGEAPADDGATTG